MAGKGGEQDGGVSSQFASITIATASFGFSLGFSERPAHRVICAGQFIWHCGSASCNLARILLP